MVGGAQGSEAQSSLLSLCCMQQLAVLKAVPDCTLCLLTAWLAVQVAAVLEGSSKEVKSKAVISRAISNIS